MEWILKDDTDARINHLHVANLRKRRHWQSIAIPGTAEAILHAEDAGRLSISARMLKEIQDEVRSIEGFSADEKLGPINAKFQRIYERKKYDDPWYKVYGVSTIREIADDIGRIKEYRHFYGSYSEISHGGNIWKNFNFRRDNPINPIRDPKNVPKLANIAATYALRTYRMVLEEYIPTEMTFFSKKYKREWRTRYLLTLPHGVKQTNPLS